MTAPRKIHYRNTRDERRCPECLGTAVIETRDSSGDPERDTERACTFEGCMGGWIRWAPSDALQGMAARRMMYLRSTRARAKAGLFGFDGRALSAYLEARRRACDPVDLPLDGPTISAETAAYFNDLARRDPTAEFNRSFARIFGVQVPA